jgi:hypothetical protein
MKGCKETLALSWKIALNFRVQNSSYAVKIICSWNTHRKSQWIRKINGIYKEKDMELHEI